MDSNLKCIIYIGIEKSVLGYQFMYEQAISGQDVIVWNQTSVVNQPVLYCSTGSVYVLNSSQLMVELANPQIM